MFPPFSALLSTGTEILTSSISFVASQGDDTGGLAASIIIVLLLIGTLVGVLVYYLRHKERVASTVPLQSASPSSPGGRGFSNEIYESDLTVS